MRKTPHDGVDIGLYSSAYPVIASADGVVSEVTFDRRIGFEIVIDHPAGLQTGYAHLERADVQPGDHVARGSRVGIVGVFPASGGVRHVHWRLWRTVPGGRRATEDPLPHTWGCFDATRFYPSAPPLALTYPVRC